MITHNTNTSPPLNGAIVTGIKQIKEYTYSETGSFRAVSLPGHLIQIVTKGEVKQEAGGITENFGAGDSVWYWENEPVCGTIIKAPWKFYSVSFTAPSLPPPPLNERIKTVNKETANKMRLLLLSWKDHQQPRMTRHIKLHSLLLEIILDLLSETAKDQSAETEAGIWWKIEANLRSDISQPLSLESLCRIAHRSERSIFRSCKKATGLSPMKRIKQIRLSYARGLVQFSQLPISEIAYNIGYERVQEFSRDYKKIYACTPSFDRSQSLLQCGSSVKSAGKTA
jgi:AraC-like DNA-binding protein